VDDGGLPGVGVRYVVDVGPGSSGVRVVVRHRLPDGQLADVLGQLLSWKSGRLSVQRRDGSVVCLDAAAVVAAKQVPPAPARRR